MTLSAAAIGRSSPEPTTGARLVGGRPAVRIAEQNTRFSPRLFRGFDWWLGGYLRKHFDGVRVLGSLDQVRAITEAAPERGLVVYSNHPSWWDPILFFVVGGRVFPHHAGFGPMDAQQVERYRFFRRLGVFGVSGEAGRGARTFLRAAGQILEHDRALLWVTGQGEFVDVRERPVRLRPGLGALARSLGPKVPELTFLPCALELTHWTERLPEALFAFGEPVRWSEHEGSRPTVAGWTQLLERHLEGAQDRLASAARRRQAEEWSTVLDGQRGVGGVYDRWRAMRARLRGEQFEAGHLQDSAEEVLEEERR